MKKISSFVFLILISGCAYNGSIVGKKVEQLKQNSLSKDNKDYLKELEVKPNSGDYLLYYQEAGKIAFVLDDTKTSIDKFNKAISFYKQQEDIARLNANDASKKALSSTLLDDNVLQYKGSDYELAFVHFYQAINYLKNQDLDKSMVEIRASNDAQKLAIANHEKNIKNVESKINSYKFSGQINEGLKQATQYRGDEKSKFLNGLIYYVSGNIREIAGDKNGALVDYKNAYELSYDNMTILSDLLRLTQNYDNSYYNTLLKNKPNTKFLNNEDYKQSKTILIIYEDNFMPTKRALEGSVYLYQVDKFAKISLPSYNKAYSLNNPNLILNGEKFNLEYTTNVYNLASNELAEKYPDILLRQISRLVTKMTMQNVGNSVNNNDSKEAAILKLVIGIFGAVSSLAESADLRSYTTLPQQMAVFKVNTKDNISTMQINAKGRVINLDNIDVKNGEIAILYVVDSGSYIYYNTIYKGNK